MSRVLRSAAVFAFVSLVAALSMPGCSQQGQGERCDNAKTGDADCNSGLTCVPAIQLLDQSADRCCPLEGTESDARCHHGTPGSTPTGGSSGSGGSAGSSTGGTSKGGAASGGTATAGSSGSGGTADNGGTTSNAGASGAATDGGAGATSVEPSAGTGGAD